MSLCPPTERCCQSAHKHKQCRNENNSVPVFQRKTQLAHRARRLTASECVAGWHVLRLPNPHRVLVGHEAARSIPCNPKKADDEQCDTEKSHGVRSGLTIQAQRPGTRDATIANRDAMPGSLQRMVRGHRHPKLPPRFGVTKKTMAATPHNAKRRMAANIRSSASRPRPPRTRINATTGTASPI